MNKKSFFLKVLGSAVLILVGFLLSLGWQERSVEPQTGTSLKSQEAASQASIMIDTGKDILGFSNVKIEPQDTVWSVLKRLSESQAEKLKIESQDYGEMGVLITAVNGVKGGEDDKYWQYWVNNEYAQVAADKQSVNARDVIMWKFTGSKFKEY